MPSYYNHSDKPASKEDIEVNSREINKLKIKHAKALTNRTRLDIAQELECSVRTVDTLWKEVQSEEAFRLEDKVDSEIRRQIRQYEMMNIELFEAWLLSKQRLEKITRTEGYTGDNKVLTEKIHSEDRLPDPRYLEQITKNNKEIASMLGITKAAEININQQNNEFNVISEEFTTLVPEQHDRFTKKPKELPVGEFTSIEDVDEVNDEPPESID